MKRNLEWLSGVPLVWLLAIVLLWGTAELIAMLRTTEPPATIVWQIQPAAPTAPRVTLRLPAAWRPRVQRNDRPANAAVYYAASRRIYPGLLVQVAIVDASTEEIWFRKLAALESTSVGSGGPGQWYHDPQRQGRWKLQQNSTIAIHEFETLRGGALCRLQVTCTTAKKNEVIRSWTAVLDGLDVSIDPRHAADIAPSPADDKPNPAGHTVSDSMPAVPVQTRVEAVSALPVSAAPADGPPEFQMPGSTSRPGTSTLRLRWLAGVGVVLILLSLVQSRLQAWENEQHARQTSQLMTDLRSGVPWHEALRPADRRKPESD